MIDGEDHSIGGQTNSSLEGSDWEIWSLYCLGLLEVGVCLRYVSCASMNLIRCGYIFNWIFFGWAFCDTIRLLTCLRLYLLLYWILRLFTNLIIRKGGQVITITSIVRSLLVMCAEMCPRTLLSLSSYQWPVFLLIAWNFRILFLLILCCPLFVFGGFRNVCFMWSMGEFRFSVRRCTGLCENGNRARLQNLDWDDFVCLFWWELVHDAVRNFFD